MTTSISLVDFVNEDSSSLTPKAKRYVRLNNLVDKYNEKANWYTYGRQHDNIKYESWKKKAIAQSAKQSELETKMTPEDKLAVLDYYTVTDMFEQDYDELEEMIKHPN